MLHLLGAAPPRRPPFSDWLAQVDRICAKRYGTKAIHMNANPVVQGLYQCGLAAGEAAAALNDERS